MKNGLDLKFEIWLNFHPLSRNNLFLNSLWFSVCSLGDHLRKGKKIGEAKPVAQAQYGI